MKILPTKKSFFLLSAMGVVFFSFPARAENDEALAKKLSDPIGHVINVPFQFNYDQNFVPNDGYRWTLNIQPVIPFTLDKKWSLITRTIVPVIYQDKVVGTGDQFGLSDIVQSFFFKPNIWPSTTFAFGPVIQYPSATDSLIGSGKWGIGPTAILVQHTGPWVLGLLTNQIWSFAGSDSRDDVNKTFAQPFVSYITPGAWTFTLTSETTYDWAHEEASVPVNFTVSKLVKFGAQPVQFFGGMGYWAEHPDAGPRDWRARLGFTLVFAE
jgi:hypothetical protein